MSLVRDAIVGAVLTLSFPLAAPARVQAGPTVWVAPIQTDLAPREHIGRRQTGMLCGPDGGLAWRNADYTSAEGQSVSVTALRAASVAIAPDEQSATYRLEGKIVGAHLDACVAQHGRLVLLVGGRRTTKINGTVRLEWTVRDRARATIKTIADEQTVRLASPDANVRQAIEAAITASAAKLAPQLATLKP